MVQPHTRCFPAEVAKPQKAARARDTCYHRNATGHGAPSKGLHEYKYRAELLQQPPEREEVELALLDNLFQLFINDDSSSPVVLANTQQIHTLLLVPVA